MINENLDWDAIKAIYSRDGRIRIENFLRDDIAEEIRQFLASNAQWDLYCSGANGAVTYTSEQLSSLTQQQHSEILRSLHAVAAKQFAFFYYRYNLLNDEDTIISRFRQYISGQQYMNFARYISGSDSINSVTAGATCFKPGCFITLHDDLHEKEGRKIAQVFGFTKSWNPDWGGTLHFLDQRMKVTGVEIPSFNTLDLLKVPQNHFVSQVCSYATEKRFSITGWLHERKS